MHPVRGRRRTRFPAVQAPGATSASLTNRRTSGTVPSVSTPLKRVVAVAVLLGCQAPGTFALAAGLDLAAHFLPFEHEHDTMALARSATHGHHHDDEVVPDHDHDATLDSEAGVQPPDPSATAVLALPSSASLTSAEESLYDAASRRGPPPLLFRTHCALLL